MTASNHRITRAAPAAALGLVAASCLVAACAKDAPQPAAPAVAELAAAEPAVAEPAVAEPAVAAADADDLAGPDHAQPAAQPAASASARGDTLKGIDMSAIFDTPVNTLDGAPSSLGAHKGNALLVVNVASKCGLTPQYADLEKLHKEYKDRGFEVVGFPCNQFGGQEPGTAEEIKKFCSLTYGVTFPMFEKIEVNGAGRHPIYVELTKVPDADGQAGDIQWNFEKFLISADGTTITRFRPRTTPYDPAIISALEASLPRR